MRVLADTSYFIALEAERPFAADVLSAHDEVGVSVVTLAELRLGVLMTDDPAVRAGRLITLERVAVSYDAVPIEADTAEVWARLVSDLRRRGRRASLNDVWIAASAVTQGIPVVTQDADFDAIDEVEVIRV